MLAGILLSLFITTTNAVPFYGKALFNLRVNLPSIEGKHKWTDQPRDQEKRIDRPTSESDMAEQTHASPQTKLTRNSCLLGQKLTKTRTNMRLHEPSGFPL